jgi:hypothetical protein
MRLLDGELVLSPSDLTKFTRCAHVTTLDLGRLRGRLKPLAYPTASGERCAGRYENPTRA